MRAQRRVFAWESGADVACELGARVDGVRRQRVGVFVSAGEAVGGAGGVGVSVLILSVFSSRSTVSGGFVALFCIVPSFFYTSLRREDLKIPLFTNLTQHMPTPFSKLHEVIVAQNTFMYSENLKVKVLRLALPLFT